MGRALCPFRVRGNAFCVCQSLQVMNHAPLCHACPRRAWRRDGQAMQAMCKVVDSSVDICRYYLLAMIFVWSPLTELAGGQVLRRWLSPAGSHLRVSFGTGLWGSAIALSQPACRATSSTDLGEGSAQVTQMARQMVVNYGFSDIGPWSLLDQNAQSGDMIMRMMARNSTSESLQRKIDAAVRKIATEAYEVALDHIRCAPKPLSVRP